jgi:hypothetical protein
MSMKNSSDTIGNRTCDLPACSTMPQPTALPRASKHKKNHISRLRRIFSITALGTYTLVHIVTNGFKRLNLL